MTSRYLLPFVGLNAIEKWLDNSIETLSYVKGVFYFLGGR